MSEFIEFKIAPLRLAALQRVFTAFQADKKADAWRTDEELLSLFDEEAINAFYWPPEDVRKQRLQDLQNRPIVITQTGMTPGARWDFDSLVDAFVNGEYELLSCELTGDGRAQMQFYSFAYPYGGVGCMVGLIEAFGGEVTGIDDGTGFISFEKS